MRIGKAVKMNEITLLDGQVNKIMRIGLEMIKDTFGYLDS